MSGIKSLAKDTAIYGISSIVGRLLNYLLVPFYTRIFAPGEYGIVGTLYGYTGILLVILNYGMETGFFRFVNKHKAPMTVYTTSLCSVGITSVAFMVLISLFINPISSAIHMGGYRLFVWILGITVAIDAFTNIPFAYLRHLKRAKHFALVKMANIALNIALNIFFLIVCPWLQTRCPAAIEWFYAPAGGSSFGVGWIFVANLISSLMMLLMLSPQLKGLTWRFDTGLLRRMLNFSFPILITGVAGTFAHNMGQIFIPYIFSDAPAQAEYMVGIYSANIKIAVILTMFTQAFRYAYEPFIFSNAASDPKGRNQAYCDAMKYFVIFAMLIFMGVMFCMPIIKHLIGRQYWSGLSVVPIMMGSEICFGIYFNLSIWYKLTDRTIWGSWFSIITFVIMAALNIVLVRRIGPVTGYMGSAWAALISYAVVMVLCWWVGKKYFPLDYPIGKIFFYIGLSLVLTFAGMAAADRLPDLMSWGLKTIFLLIFLLTIVRKENILSLIKRKK